MQPRDVQHLLHDVRHVGVRLRHQLRVARAAGRRPDERHVGGQGVRPLQGLAEAAEARQKVHFRVLAAAARDDASEVRQAPAADVGVQLVDVVLQDAPGPAGRVRVDDDGLGLGADQRLRRVDNDDTVKRLDSILRSLMESGKDDNN